MGRESEMGKVCDQGSEDGLRPVAPPVSGWEASGAAQLLPNSRPSRKWTTICSTLYHLINK